MNKVLFVCLGNICRSPAAEAVMLSQLESKGLNAKYDIDSAGIIDMHQGKRADARMRHHCKQRGFHADSISRPVVLEDFSSFDLILAMDNRNFRDLYELCPRESYKEKIKMMTDYRQSLSYDEVPDPYFGGEQGFELVLDILEDSIHGLIENLES